MQCDEHSRDYECAKPFSKPAAAPAFAFSVNNLISTSTCSQPCLLNSIALITAIIFIPAQTLCLIPTDSPGFNSTHIHASRSVEVAGHQQLIHRIRI
jgi:hypothetical protein